MEFLSTVMPIILCSLTSILVIILIVLAVKLIITVDKINLLADDVKKKVESLNGFFNIVDLVTNKVSLISDRVIETISSVFTRIFSKKKYREDDINE